MSEISYRSLVWLTYQLGGTFAFGLPLVISIWSLVKKELSIARLLSIYWKVASLMVISMFLLIGNRPIGYITSFVSPLLILTSLWFWIDLNEEINELPPWKALALTVKIWRWAISLFCFLYATVSFGSLNCIQDIKKTFCFHWTEAPSTLNQILKNIFNFLFGATWTETLAAFIGYLALLLYLVGLIQWLMIRFPKQGRISGGF